MLCKDTNLTIIVRLFRRDAILHLDRKANVMKGLLGKKWDTLLGRPPFRSCKLVPADQLGIQASPQNATFNGAFGLLQRKEGDFLFNRYSQYFKKDWLEHSPPVLSEQSVLFLSFEKRFQTNRFYFRMLVAHRIEKRDIIRLNTLTKAVDIDKRFQLVLLVLIMAFIISLTFLGRLLTSDRPMKSSVILEHLLGFRLNRKTLTKFGLVLVFFRWELFFCKIIYANAIKTSTVVLDTSHFVTSLQQLLKSDYVVCFFENHILFKIAVNSDPNTILNRLLVEKSVFKTGVNALNPRFKENCVINLSRLNRQMINWTGKALFVNRIIANLVLKSHTGEREGDYFLSKPMFDLIAVNYYRTGLLPSQRAQIERL